MTPKSLPVTLTEVSTLGPDRIYEAARTQGEGWRGETMPNGEKSHVDWDAIILIVLVLVMGAVTIVGILATSHG